MTVFADAVDATFAAFGIDAVYTPMGGAPFRVRVIVKRPEPIAAFDEKRIHAEFERGLDRADVGHVAGIAARLVVADGRRSALFRLAVAVERGGAPAALSQQAGGRGADADATAGDEDSAAGFLSFGQARQLRVTVARRSYWFSPSVARRYSTSDARRLDASPRG